MGTYLYTLKNKTVTAYLLPSKEPVTIALAEYLCKDTEALFQEHSPSYKNYSKERTKIKKSSNLLNSNNFKANFIAIDKFEGAIYDFKPLSVFSDTPCFPFGLNGFLVKLKNKFYIVPQEKDGSINFKKYLPELWDIIIPACIYVKINNFYTATVQRLQSFEDFIFDPNENVSPNLMISNTDKNVPLWFYLSVSQLIQKKNLSPIKT